MRAIVFSALFALGSLWATGAAMACSGPDQGAKAVLDGADVIFIGKAVRSHWDITSPPIEGAEEFDGSKELVATTFEVRKVLKGTPGKQIEIVHAFPLGGNCGVLFAPGQTALVLANCASGQCGTDVITMAYHLNKEERQKLLSLLNVEEPKPFEDEESE